MSTFSFLPGSVALVGAGPGDPDLLTLKALKALQAAEVVIHDRLVSDGILSLANPAAAFVAVGKEGFGPSVPQEVTNDLIVAHARAGARVVRLKGGDPAVFARLDEEITALEEAGIAWQVVPGITAASAAAASLGQGLTQRGRNQGVRLVTGHDVKGFADQDWRALAAPGAVAAIYMGKRASRFLQGRLMMHGAAPDTPVTLVENASRPEERVLAATLATLPEAAADLAGPAILMWGLAPRAVSRADLSNAKEAFA